MNQGEIKFCPRCGAGDLATHESTLSHVLELYCLNCGTSALLLWSEHDLVGSTAQRDPDSDSESW
jgi:ribosomal protein S27AE